MAEQDEPIERLRAQAAEHFAAKRWAASAERLERLVARAPDDAAGNVELARSLYLACGMVLPGMMTDEQQATLERARAALEHVVADVDPSHVTAHRLLAAVCDQLGETERAEACRARVTALHDSLGEPHVQRGIAHLGAGRLEEGVDALTAGLERRCTDETRGLALERRAKALAKLGRLAPAVEDWTRVLALRPDRPGAHQERAALLARLGRRDEALADLEVVLAGGDPDGAGHRARAELLEELGRGGEAERLRAEADRRLHAWRNGGAQAAWEKIFPKKSDG